MSPPLPPQPLECLWRYDPVSMFDFTGTKRLDEPVQVLPRFVPHLLADTMHLFDNRIAPHSVHSNNPSGVTMTGDGRPSLSLMLANLFIVCPLAM